ncbi:hypothetical protein SC8A11.05 [Streptomyces coelicolor A3(2)]|uniref:Transcription regulator TrmB N-terminal domain-containing protein n=1 Tax=Streptomyces coelicolor (strain ATCC BAA-471 / A3(2) / M145) TaxID=100226 RepID=Q9FC05_STRCO|nr:hypothetical protein SC8A11.05 [Streptomyces coelicolor A3(2)]
MAEADAPMALVGLDADTEAVYRELLTRGGGTADSLVTAFGLNRSQAVAQLDRLHRSGLLSRRSSGEYQTVDPRHALAALVESRTRQLAAVRDAASSLGELFDEARRSGTPQPDTRTISGAEEVGDCYYRLKQAARREICELHARPTCWLPTSRWTRPQSAAGCGYGPSTPPPASTTTVAGRTSAAWSPVARRPEWCPRCPSSSSWSTARWPWCR